MTVRKLYFLAAVFGLLTSTVAFAEPKASQPVSATSAADNQKLADAVADKLRSSGVMKGSKAKIDIEASGSTVTLRGMVADEKQLMDILRTTTSVAGVKRVVPDVDFMSDVRRTAAQEPSPLAIPGAAPSPFAPVPPPPVRLPAAPTSLQGGAGAGAGPQDPVPLNGGVMMGPLDPAGPKLPPYAWPTYAPYNNYSRVAYPSAYPYNAFPYIGPFYPFPKVPLGWRKVVLEWDDGHWFLGRLSTPHDYWRVRFW